MQPTHVFEVRPRSDHRGVDLISDALPFGRLWYGGPGPVANAIGYAKFFSRSHDAVIRVYDAAGNVIDTYGRAGEFKKDKRSKTSWFMTSSNQVRESECRHAHVFEVRPRKDNRGVDLISNRTGFKNGG